ncbi:MULTISPECIES: hypothetical protein [unclassified Nonomuraea]|uniref:hypothetical protein n=1 Tax=unclassified Nonomuraea TaxID=2593643 RepID=UPI0033CB576A
MGTEAFYTTAAQVLPTMLIALSVELLLLTQGRVREWKEKVAKWDKEKVSKRGPMPFEGGDAALGPFWIYVLLAVVFVVGEVAAFLAIGAGWRNAGTFWTVGSCLLIMIVGAAGVPIARLDAALRWR